ncbi:MAG: chondroitinase family polysaccharide lyase [Alistipes sp.]
MKKMLKYGTSIVLALLSTFFCITAMAAIDAKINFETEISKAFVCDANSQIELSDAHFKDGSKSLRWSWNAPSALRYSDAAQLLRSSRVKGAGVMLWIYNPKAADADMRFTFETPTGQAPYYFDFHMDFIGWRACWIQYNDMPGDHASQQLSRLIITTPKGVASGEIFIDRLSFSEEKLNAQITPDQQIPNNNCNLTRELWHWGRLWEWEQNAYEVPLTEPTAAQLAQLKSVKSRINDILSASMSSGNYINGTIIPRALANLTKAAIRRTADGGVIGAPLLSNDECNRPIGEMREDDVENMLYAFALDSYVNGNSTHDDNFFLVFDYAIDQGFAFGSGMGTNHHYGYNIRKIYDAMWLMRDKIAKRGKTDEYVRVLTYWSGLGETRKPYTYGRDELLDSWHTLLIPKIVSALMLPTEAEQYRAMQSLGIWLSGSLDFTPGTIGGIKRDGTTFHHGGLYPAYSVGAFATIGYYCKATTGTDFALTEPARKCFKLALQTLRNYTNWREWGLGIAGRHPFGSNRIPDADVNAFGYLAAQGDLTGSGKAVDPELAADYLRLKGTDKQLNDLFKKEGISAASAPQGFFVFNYGALGIHRRGDWMVTLKGYNTDVWGSEIYTKDNRFGRYQSYGTVQIYGTGSPVTAKESGFVQPGWDWNRAPGATTIHLPFEELNNPLRGTLMERNSKRFTGTSSLEGRNGVLAFQFVEGNRQNFTAGATAHKSVFCFDNRLVFIGSGITNDNQMYPTETTLYQLNLDDTGAQIEVDGEFLTAFPLDVSKSGVERVMLSDTKGNFYVVKNAGALRVIKQNQSSPNDKTLATQSGNFATAYLDHGRAPQEASYEYALYIQPSNKEIGRIAKKDAYEVVRRDNDAHVVKDLATGITAYVCFSDYTGQGLVRTVSGETIVMERTDANGQLVVSVCTPDLGLTEKSYTTRQESQPLEKQLLIDGNWTLATQYPNVEAVTQSNETLLKITCHHGQPVDFKLNKN